MLYTINAYTDKNCLDFPVLYSCKTGFYATALHTAKELVKHYGFIVLKNNETGNRETFSRKQ